MISYTQCPVCRGEKINKALSAADHTVSNETFVIMKCDTCTLLFTQDVPSQNEIGKYYLSENYISHSDTQKGLVSKLYHAVRKRTLSAKKNLLERETEKRKGEVLDIGCGTGAFLNAMQHAGWSCTGLEPDETARRNATTLYRINPLQPEILFDLPAKKYDAITMWHVLEHVHELHRYIEQLSVLLKDSGKIFIAVPNYTSCDAQYYKKDWAAYDVPRHLYHFSPQSMDCLISQHGLVIKKIKPMWFDSFYVSMLSEKYKNGKGNIIRAFFIGLASNIRAMKNKKKCSSLIYIISKK